MDPLPQEVGDYIRESIEHTLGLPVSAQILELKLRCSEAAKRRLREQYTVLLAKLKEKDQALDRFGWVSYVFLVSGRGLYERSGFKEVCGGESETSGRVCASGESV
ncbi:hypothetical protein RchiOBHm_Chr5g0044811 [Rosa chinensis]|uniref:Uncharacterized protein n=1 Tax=Rosa chinensis TaxID=74649 RepID=A0A2P6QDQ8_ROSCH|nr:hypothetical protein RchiOBHm_Chr5g0044811 [Rosa chinensis]